MDIKALLETHKVKTAFVGGALVVSTAWGSCHLTPTVPTAEPVPAPQEEAPQPDEEKAGEEKDAEPEGK